MSDSTNNYPQGEAGPDSESGPVDAAESDGARESRSGEPRSSRVGEDDRADTAEDGSLAPTATAVGSPTVDAGTAPGDVHATQTDHDPSALVEGNRVATAEDME